jgi:hypothetical protein
MPAETRKDTHDVLRDANEPDSPRYHSAYAYVEINAVHPRDIASRHDDVVNACALVRRDIYIDVSPVPGIGLAVEFTPGAVALGRGTTLADRAGALAILVEAFGAALSDSPGAVRAVLPLGGRGRPA